MSSLLKFPQIQVKLVPTIIAMESAILDDNIEISDDNVVDINTNDEQRINSQLSSNLDGQVFAQYLLLLYTNIFINQHTSSVFTDILNNIITGIHDTTSDTPYNSNSKITDSVLDEYLINHLVDTNQVYNVDMEQLRIIAARVPVKDIIPEYKSIITLLDATYGNNDVVNDSVVDFNIRFTNNKQCPIALEACGVVKVDSTVLRTGKVNTPFWRYTFSIISSLTNIHYALQYMARKALPMNPTLLVESSLMTSVVENQVGIPFLNYIAMLVRERSLHKNEAITALTRRDCEPTGVLVNRVFNFCGTGAYRIVDVIEATTFVYYFGDPNSDSDAFDELPEEDKELIRRLRNGVLELFRNSVKFVRNGISNESLVSTEAISDTSFQNPGTDNTEDDDTPDKKGKKPKADASLEIPPTMDDTTEEPDPNTDPEPDGTGDDSDVETPPTMDDNGVENNDNDIDPSNTDSQDVEASNTHDLLGKFIPLASADEGVDDHITRMIILNKVNQLSKNPDPQMPPEDLEVLQTWCNSWLFISSVATTKKLLTQLKLTEFVKELE